MTDTTTPARGRPRRSPRAAVRLQPRLRRMAGDATSVRAARHLVDEILEEGPSELRDIAALLTGELVTNAVVHGGGRFLLLVDVAPGRLRVEVADPATARPRLVQMTGDSEHGRGMTIVDALATAWGTDQLGTHKVVWFEICLDPESVAAPRPLAAAEGDDPA